MSYLVILAIIAKSMYARTATEIRIFLENELSKLPIHRDFIDNARANE